MRAVVQRVKSASVTIAGEITGEIGPGLLVLLGVARGDSDDDGRWLAAKLPMLRVFEDADGKMNRSLMETGGGLLVVSQFTLLGSVRKGTRPSFNDAAPPELARDLYEKFVVHAAAALGRPVATGRFAEMMEVALVNDGPVTLVIDTKSRE
jgi:D-tyrosyl-tRNA(Tyr) deacylase